MPLTSRRNDRGASTMEYTALVVLAAVVLGAVAIVVPNPLSSGIKTELCAVFHGGNGADCGERPAAANCTAFCPGPGHPIHPSDPVTAATKGNYVALGDSYASGEGSNNAGGNYFTSKNKPYLKDPRGNSDQDQCHRSANAYAQGLGKQFTFKRGTSSAACSGAGIDDLYRGRYNEKPQIGKAANPQLNQHTSAVTISVGGNDVGFSEVLTACMLDPHIQKITTFGNEPESDRCTQQGPAIQRKMNDLFRPRPEYHGLSKYQKALSDIHDQAPNARIMVVGYPHIFPDPPKKGYDLIDKDDQKFLNDQDRRLDSTIAQQVQQLDQRVYGGKQAMGSFEYVDNWNGLENHEITAKDPWINGVELCPGKINFRHNSNCTGAIAGTGSFHPTPAGQASFERNVARQLQQGPGRVLYDP